MKCYLCNRFKERSTWIGIGAMFSAAHYWFTDITVEAFLTMVTAITGFIATVVPDQK